MDAQGLRVIADDLTGACDIAAALLPWPEPLYVQAYAGAQPPGDAGLWVRNTQSRTLSAAEARRLVRDALAGPGASVVLKKIDTALRGHLGAELDAAMDAVGAEEAFVLPAIPSVNRTTMGGVQLIDGVPIHRTAFASDPLHPVDRSDVAGHAERGCGRRCRAIELDEVRSHREMLAAIDRGRREGCSIFVCDAICDDDLDRGVAALLERRRPVVLAGSLGLGRALRRRLAAEAAAAPPALRRPGGPALVVVGSAHPAAREQRRALPAATCIVGEGQDAERSGRRAAATLAGGGHAVLCAPPDVTASDGARVLDAMARAVVACVAECRPGALALVGGETAHAVLRSLEQPAIRVIAALEPLVVVGELVGGMLAGTPVVTKGGSSGDARSVARALAWMADGR